MPELSESFRNKLQSWDDLGAIRARNRDGNSRNLANRRRGASSASNVLHRMSLPVVFGQKTQDKRVDFKGYKIFDKTRSYKFHIKVSICRKIYVSTVRWG